MQRSLPDCRRTQKCTYKEAEIHPYLGPTKLNATEYSTGLQGISPIQGVYSGPPDGTAGNGMGH